jgi:hypothetical protein
MYLGSADKFDRDNAKLMLSAYRPNGADAQDPVFKEALELAQRDPELARWFRGERDFDQMISSKLRLQDHRRLDLLLFLDMDSSIGRRSSPRWSLGYCFSGRWR